MAPNAKPAPARSAERLLYMLRPTVRSAASFASLFTAKADAVPKVRALHMSRASGLTGGESWLS